MNLEDLIPAFEVGERVEITVRRIEDFCPKCGAGYGETNEGKVFTGTIAYHPGVEA